MKMSWTQEGTRLRVYLSGELDHHAANAVMREIEERLESVLPRDCAIDMSRVTFMDSSGIAVVLKAYRLENALGGRLCVENVPPQPMRVFDASGIERLIKITALA